jgi:cytochrome c oxidase subunit 4
MSEHIATTRSYGLAWLVLLVLTGLTTGVAYIDMGVYNMVAAVAIAIIKALLIVVLFMHLTKSTMLTRVIASGALVWLGIMILLTMTDYVTRGWLPVPGK